jgi:hypothetical protein
MKQPLFILLFIVVLMTVISFINFKSEFVPDFLSEIKIARSQSGEVKIISKTIVSIDSNTKDTIRKVIQVVVPVSQMALPDTFSVKNIALFGQFFQALDSLKAGKKKKIRIAYFGDSMIEGDFITDDLRRLFQNKYGGNGVGYVPVTSAVAHFRQTISHTFSDDWTDYNFTKRGKKKLYLSGHTFLGAEESNVRYKTVKKYGPFQEVYLLHGPGNCTLFMKADTMQKEMNIEGMNFFNRTVLLKDASVKELTIQNNTCKEVDLYGLSFETERGVVLDNYSFRGISGLEYNDLASDVYAETASAMPYDLIILHYGLNVINDTILNYHWYESRFDNVVRRFKTYFPKATILIVSVSDKAYKSKGIFVTSPAVPALVCAQERIAEKEKVSFWNLYQAMGGYNSMVRWVTAKPLLASSDYTHVNNGGAKKIATMLYNYIDAAYNQSKISDSAQVTLPQKK